MRILLWPVALVLLLTVGPTVAAPAVATVGLAGSGSAPSASVAVRRPLQVGQPRPAPSEGVWPLRPRPAVVAGFDPPAPRWSAGHRGVDLEGSPNALVRSSLAGTVTFAGSIAGRGVVVVGHGSTRTTYEPVAAAVAVGDRVAAGAVIGSLQLFGSHCFPRWCLHWGLIEGRDHYLDPLTLVGAAPVRLLPLGRPTPQARGWAWR